VVVGHSLGGAVALAAGVRRPELMRALVLEDPAPLAPGEPQRSVQRGAEFLESLEPSRTAPDDGELVRRRREAHPEWPESELLVTGLAEQQMDHAYLEHGDWKPSPTWPELFGAVAVPTLVVTGDREDEVIVGRELEQGIADLGNALVGLVRVQGAGHCVRRDQPSAYYRWVDEWLEAH
jgi:pimeloyl-ACP methyl ester carboxylesterase